MTRQAPPNLAAFTPEQVAERDRFVQSRKPRDDGSPGGLFDPWMTNAELFHRLTGLGGMFPGAHQPGPAPRRAAICITGKFWGRPMSKMGGAGVLRAVEFGVPIGVHGRRAGRPPPDRRPLQGRPGLRSLPGPCTPPTPCPARSTTAASQPSASVASPN